MKKFALSFFVVFTFGIYVLQQKFGNDEGNVVAPPASSNSLGSGSGGSLPGMSGSPPAGVSYKDGVYTGDVTDAYYGNVQVKAVIGGGKISDVQFLQYPSDRQTSIEINSQAMPYLKQEAIQVQNANVDTISGATQTSRAFRQSLQSALDRAK